MMHPMHIWCDHDPSKQTIPLTGNAHIAMVEHGGGVQQDFEDEHGCLVRRQCSMTAPILMNMDRAISSG